MEVLYFDIAVAMSANLCKALINEGFERSAQVIHVVQMWMGMVFRPASLVCAYKNLSLQFSGFGSILFRVIGLIALLISHISACEHLCRGRGSSAALLASHALHGEGMARVEVFPQYSGSRRLKLR